MITTRQRGFSGGPYAYGNLAFHVGDDAAAVKRNRAALAEAVGVTEWQWLTQVHGSRVFNVRERTVEPAPQADACYTRQREVVCAVLTADCLPVLLCSRHGDEVAAVHAGWRGLCAGILQHSVRSFRAPPSDLLAYLGPAIGPLAFEVGSDVLEAYRDSLSECGIRDGPAVIERCFNESGREGKYLADLSQMAREHLLAEGVITIEGGNACTYTDERRFYSYRRDGETGRFVSAIYLR